MIQKRIYWHVVDDDTGCPGIHGTTNDQKASHFYIQHIKNNPPQFYVVHKPSDSGIPLYATVLRPFNAHAPLKLLSSSSTGTDQDICFTLENPVQTDGASLTLPDTAHSWTSQGPFIIKLPGGSGLISWLWKHERYVGMEASDGTYTTVSYAKREQSRERRNNMLFSLGNVVPLCGKGGSVPLSGPPPPPPQGENEIIRWSAGDETETTNAAFYELVGKDYVFP